MCPAPYLYGETLAFNATIFRDKDYVNIIKNK